MKIFLGLLIAALLLACGLGWYSYSVSTDQAAWWNGLIQNVAAELIGLGLGIFLPAAVAAWMAKKRFRKLTPDLVELIAQLRKGGTINPEAARACVVCAVKILSEDSFELLAKESRDVFHVVECPICGKDAHEALNRSGTCQYCKLPGHMWNIPKGDSSPR